MSLIADLLEAWQRAWREVRTRNVEAREKCAIAKAFNDRYCYRHKHPTVGDNCWMCPECNITHARIGHDFLTGLQYPACCSYPAGHRFGQGIRV